MILGWWLACTGGDEGDAKADPYPLDDVLRLNQLQAKGTHNSYHVQTSTLPAWSYDHAPLEVQLQEQGVRHFELDVWWDELLGEHRVLHVPVLDAGTSCETFRACVGALERWSSAHLGHHPLMVLVETKDSFDSEEGPALLDALDEELRSAWPEERLLTPARVQGSHPDLATAVAQEGWPVLGEVRGHALFVLHDGSERRDAYVQELQRRPMFPDAMGDLQQPWAAFHTLNRPEADPIEEVVSQGHLVRTRADEDPANISDSGARRDLALASGAQFVSTDFPVPAEGGSYQVDIPQGTPSRCNPLTAPADCTSVAIEDPSKL